jgi:class 3 adenylate cyclase/tetratricopeptide (TPR) repeat protein
VTILFVDLVGFTERSDQADPEDVRRTLVPFHSRVKEDLEIYGGTVDKFIGDAVMGVFGAPVAHEDDPVRAVRAALRILESIGELRRHDPGIAVRVAVNTGEAVVAFGAGPQVGEAVAGDVVNTASRMQSLAPPDSVVIGETTLRAVRGLFDTEPQPPAMVKGKSEPLSVWRVLGERIEPSADVAPTIFVGRELELDQLLGAYDVAVERSSIQLVTLIGEPGIGKTRLIEEFRRRLGDRGTWLSGRCMPYGEMTAFAPVADIVREAAGIQRAEDVTRVAGKLRSLVERNEPEPTEREWLVSRLEPVLGVEVGDDRATIPAREMADAWARVARSAGGGRPLVLEIEDLHWAEPVLLEVVERLTYELARDRVLLLCSARPELLERAASWGGGTNSTSIGLTALTDVETSELLTTLLSQVVLAGPQRASLLERAGGNPLYALEFARMLGERRRHDSLEISMPHSVQAVIAARLDAIPPGLRSLVHDASILGARFWPGALVALGDRSESDVHDGVQALVHRGLAEPADVSSFDDQREYGFTHALVREVAYGRIPRADRARLHRVAGTWIEHAGGRGEDRAEMLARHFATAVELAEMAGDREVAEAARGPALRWLMAAGERIARLDAAAAFTLYERAAALAPEESGERAEALSHAARMGRRSGRLDGREVLHRCEEALGIRRLLGDPIGVGAALTSLASQAGAIGDAARSRDLLAEAVGILEAQPAGRELARAYAYRGEEAMFAGRGGEAIEFADRSLDLLRERRFDELVVMCLHIRGDARCSTGDPAGLEDLREALRLSEASANAADIVTSQNYLGEWLLSMEGPAAGLASYESALELADRRGVVSQGQWTKGAGIGALFDLGEWDRALEWCEELLALGSERLDGSILLMARTVKCSIALLRDRPEEVETAQELLAIARPVEELHALCPAIALAAELELANGRVAEAAAYLEEFASVTSGVAAEYRESRLAPVVRACVQADRVPIAVRMIDESEGRVTRDRLNVLAARGTVAEARRDLRAAASLYRDAADEWRRFGNPFEEAQSLLGLARCAADGHEGDDPEGRVGRARSLLDRLGVRTR